MKTIKYIVLLLFQLSIAQQSFHNFGNIQIHDQGQIGFHTHLINDGIFNQNLGLAGFYNEMEALSISGTQIPRFFSMEVDVINHLNLYINTEVINDISFFNGDVITPRLNPDISLDFLSDAFYVLEDDERNTDGYSSYSGNLDFTFPIGHDNKLRPLITPIQTGNPKFKAAYFNEDANFPSTFTTNFDTDNSEVIIKEISINEFWDFDGDTNTQVTLTWDQESDIQALVSDLLNLRVVGWNIAENQWKDLGNTNFTGTTSDGTITSTSFIPNEYDIITFGSLIGSDGLVVYNLFSPNGDGDNDLFVIEGLNFFSNTLEIYNRWGNIVYKKTNYQNDWNGVAEGSKILKKGEKLPSGTYFYILSLPDNNTNKVGWLYINY